jgi:hypothetical protein
MRSHEMGFFFWVVVLNGLVSFFTFSKTYKTHFCDTFEDHLHQETCNNFSSERRRRKKKMMMVMMMVKQQTCNNLRSGRRRRRRRYSKRFVTILCEKEENVATDLKQFWVKKKKKKM